MALPVKSDHSTWADDDVEKDKGSLSNDDEILASCVVSILDRGYSEHRGSTSKWTGFRVWYNPYRMLFTFTFTFNIFGVLFACMHKLPYAEKHAVAIALGNIVAAVAYCNELLLRGLFFIMVKAFQKWAPLCVRIFLTALLQHVGGIHSGCASASLVWFLFVVIRDRHEQWGVITAAVTCVVLISAIPWIRHHYHNAFEHHHRFVGWMSVVFVWIYVGLSDSINAEGGFTGTFHRLATSQKFWFIVLITILVFIPWTTVRKVPVEITHPSPRVVIVRFERGIQQGLLGRISRSAILEYHGFGIISEGIESGCHYMIIGVQGDWTRRLAEDPPTHLYTRQFKISRIRHLQVGILADGEELQFADLPYLAHFYRRGIAICTGSGIGAVLSTCAQLDSWFLIWIGADMEKTFGPVLFDIIRRRIPEGRQILFDTKKEGRRPDIMEMLKYVYTAFKAEVVIITSNHECTAELMRGCKENDMHPFGPLWDS